MESKQKEFLLEIGTEEIPDWMIEPGLASLKRLLEEGLQRARLSSAEQPVSFQMHATPRRLVAFCPGLVSRQPDSVEMVQGPPKRIAFDSQGKPTPAAIKFAAKMETTPEKLQTVTTPKGEYLACRKKDRGRPTQEILRELVPQAILGIPFPRSMYWEGKAGPRFIRPIRSLLVLFGGRVVPCRIGAVQAGAWTFGHRQLGKPRLRVRDFAGYVETLRRNYVLLDAGERRAKILKEIQGLLASEGGLRLKENEELLNTLVYLAEYPTPVAGQFDPSYLSLPEEVLVTVMRGHQKYFSVEQEGGALAPRFVAVMNLEKDRSGAIRHGHERVLRARFNDARFFWETDGKLSLEQRLEMLKQVTFQSRLGSYFEKAKRMESLAGELARKNGSTPLLAEVQTAARLAKCDLTTELVKEFTELQGVVGGLYAEREGKSKEIATAIYDHYKPQSMEDAVPRTLAGALVSLADRLDTLVGCFGVGLAPTGSKDPFALRRTAQGMIRISIDYPLPLSWRDVVDTTLQVYQEAQQQGQVPSWNKEIVWPELGPFIDDRYRYYLRDVSGYPYDEVNAVLAAAGRSKRWAPFKMLEAVHRIRQTANFEPLAVAFKRIKNILQQAEQKGLFSRRNLEERLLEPGPETELYHLYRATAQRVADHKQSGDFFSALEAIASLRPAVDHFFDKVLVMVPDADLRENRLTLLATLLSEFSTIADFSEIVTAEPKKAGSH
ncbi:MAG: glycine--tRNA ligase subunit beta [Acidobacteria bacterium]|nr:glycine--tRNA ligase subunit beta [Acidobacteriota bacterium]